MVGDIAGIDYLEGYEAEFSLPDTFNFNPIPGYLYVYVEPAASVLSPNRTIPVSNDKPAQNAVSGGSTNIASGVFTAGPNPVTKSAGKVDFFWQGKGIQNTKLTIYNASGNFVKKINITDNTNNKSDRRTVGKWDLKDAKGRAVSEGTYLMKGVITVDGKKERVSVMIGVR
ncbi:MAG: hypothetical protein LBB56_05750 [Chitinispirillales bacterium]|nr:hypothetical protein [Chitinispirillales bacterium]